MSSAKGKSELLTNATETGPWTPWPGGRGSFSVAGTSFDGATVSLQVKGPDGTTAIDVGDATSVTDAAVANFTLPPGEIRAAVSGGTSPSGLYASAVHIGG